jgi:hypothetical protein
LLSIFLGVAIGFVAWSVYRSWTAGPWDLPVPSRPSTAAVATESQAPPAPRAPVGTDAIVSKNLFDPERGAGATREAEENSRAFVRLRNMILVGTVIIGNNRTAILQDGAGATKSAPAAAGQPPGPMRLKVGDNIEGFRLTEIGDKRVVFSRDASRIEVLLDYFRKVEVAQPRAVPPAQAGAPGAAAPVPRVIPNLPRRARIPTPGNPNPAPDS